MSENKNNNLEPILIKPPPIFIIGCPRSGTTIFGKFFSNNSHCVYYDEVHIWLKNEVISNQSKGRVTLINLRKTFRKIIPGNIFVRKCHWYLKLFLQQLKILDKDKDHTMIEKDLTQEMVERTKYVLQKDLPSGKQLVIKSATSSLRIPFVLKLFPNAIFIHLIRDGRDVTCSLIRGNEGSVWMHLKPLGWRIWQKHSNGLIRCSWMWATIVQTILKNKDKIPSGQYMEIRYEDLVTNSEKTIKSLFNKLNIPFEKPQEELCRKVTNEHKKEFLIKGSTNDWTTSDHKTRIGRYKENLTSTELEQVEFILGNTNRQFGYV